MMILLLLVIWAILGPFILNYIDVDRIASLPKLCVIIFLCGPLVQVYFMGMAAFHLILDWIES